MNEDSKMFNIGLWSFICVSLVVLLMQVCSRAQNTELRRLRRDIVTTQQEIAVSQASFASYVRPEILRNMVTIIDPKAEVISFHKSVEIYELPDKIKSK